jgi:formylglycine-generating enzyme required for sulfatase activity
LALELEWREVPAGPFPMGSDPGAAYPPDDDESPRHTVELESFRLARLPVTNRQYSAFAKATGGTIRADAADDVAVNYVSRADAQAFCDWARVRLPTEHEWEGAARGGGDRLWPWGDEPPDRSRAVFASGIGSPRPGGRHARGASPHGVLDLAGNVQEWVATAYSSYPPAAGAPSGSELGVVRGGSFIHGANELRCSYRQPLQPGARDHYVGFRVAATGEQSRIAFDWVEIPRGEFTIGRDPVAYGGPALADELPQHAVHVDAFELSLTPVTNAQYASFVHAGGAAAPAHWADGSPPAALDDHPVTFVDWFDAGAFSAWVGGRLPSEAEWEKASRGTMGLPYPWGSVADSARAHVGGNQKHGRTAPVGAHADGASPYGLLGMIGNVWEWVSSAYRPYPYDGSDGREEPSGGDERVLRGGSFATADLIAARCAIRSRSHPGRRQAHIGFRIARGARG